MSASCARVVGVIGRMWFPLMAIARIPFYKIHKYRNTFAQGAMQVFCHNRMQECLRHITKFESHFLGQSMFFDQNTETAPHQDDYYLDSVPYGKMVASWFALEDIDPRAGQFYVLDGTNKLSFDLSSTEKVANHLYMEIFKKHLAENRAKYRMINPVLKKGDVLFWDSKIIHGSTTTLDRKFSRKSLTAHYIPTGHGFGNINGGRYPLALETFNGMSVDMNPDVRTDYLGMVMHNVKQDFIAKYPRVFLATKAVKQMILP